MSDKIKKKDVGDITSIAKVRYILDEQNLVCPEVEPRTEIQDQNVSHKIFKIRLADTPDGRNSASMLIDKMYSWRGYTTTKITQEGTNQITLTATEDHTVIGTISLTIDSPAGLLADEIFRDEINVIRNKGGKVCEFTKLAFDPSISLKQVLASVFHVAFIYARHIQKCTDLFIEVNPRHRRYYEGMLGFKRQGVLKSNPRVNAPAVLLWLDLNYAEQQIQKLGGTYSHPGSEKSFYPYFFSPREEEGIINRLSIIN